jgi:hypothetical protein
MAKVIFGNHSSVLVPRQDRDSVRKFYCDVLGGTITKADPERDFVRLGENFTSRFSGDVLMRAVHELHDRSGSKLSPTTRRNEPKNPRVWSREEA